MDLFVLAADKNMEYALRGALARNQSIGIRPIDFNIIVHAGRDGGVRTTGSDILALEKDNYEACMLIFDFEGSGSSEVSAIDLETKLDVKLRERIGEKSKAIVVDPECDIWMWGSDNLLAEIFEWPLDIRIRPWLCSRGFEFDENNKPMRPKEALEELVTVHRKPRSSALYQRVTSRVSLRRCVDPAYLRLRETLQTWFPD